MILAIETGIEGGSLAFYDLERKTVVNSSVGKSGISKAEDLLENLSALKSASRINFQSVVAVVFGKGIGSQTGLKIGEATAKGLAKSFGCRYIEYSFWNIFREIASKNDTEKTFYLPAGKGRIVRRRWRTGKFASETDFISFAQFAEDLEVNQYQEIFVHEELYSKDYQLKTPHLKVSNLGENFALILINYASDNETE